jgi:hypothetical protein
MELLGFPVICNPVPAMGISQLVSYITLNMTEHVSSVDYTQGYLPVCACLVDSCKKVFRVASCERISIVRGEV